MLLVYIVSGLLFVRATAGDEVETVEVKEGATVTLRTDWPSERDADIVWMFGTTNTGIALKDSSGSSTHYDERFRDRLQLDTKTGSLTISNISTTHSGDYKVQIFLYMVIFNKQFNVTVYVSQSSNSTLDLCTVLCSVTNGPKVNLSWVRNRDTLKQSSNPDLSVPLCLHLEIHLQENHIYSCVAANPVSNHSTQLNIMQFCPQTGKTISLYKLSPKEVETFCLACNTKIYLIVLPYDLYCFLKIYDYSTCDA
uniref:Ig-like domain-containing protein n=1 Tax=Pygocentrus nattereri TaxID=42514 RepID=A0AAR2JUA3_PYGNA